MIPEIPDIHQTESAFNLWRANRAHRAPTPAHLREQAVALLPHYPITRICKQLKINSQALKAWAEAPAENGHAFVILPVPSASLPPQASGLTLSLATATGLECRLTGPLQPAFIATLLQHLQAEVVR